jgi:acetyltransferase-like isoleucine patch superfamily enzyme
MDSKICVIPKNNASDVNVRITNVSAIDFNFVQIGDLLFEFETSKATFEVHSEFEGFVTVDIKEGESYEVGFPAIRFFDNIELIGSTIVDNGNHVFPSSSLGNAIFSKKAMILIEKYNLDPNEINLKCQNKEFITENDVHLILNQVNNKYCPGSIKFEDKDIVIYGTGGHAMQCLEIVEESDFVLRGYVANKYDKEFENLLLGFDVEDLKLMRADGLKNIVIGFGQLENLEARFKLYSQLKMEGFVLPNLISKQSSISRHLKVTENTGVQIFQGAVVGPQVVIKDNVVLNSNSTVSHHCIIGNGSFISPGAILAGSVKVGDFALIGMGVTVYMNVSIESYKIITNGTDVFE